jgi:thiamine pyridinylase
MRRHTRVLIVVVLAVNSLAGLGCAGSRADDLREGANPPKESGLANLAPQRTLRVALYPLVPGYDEMKEMVRAAYREVRRDTRLEFVDLTNYYKASEPNSIVNNDAQVVEIDSVFLDDLEPTLQRLPKDAIQAEAFHPASVALTKRSDGWVAAPHWLCSNFLFATPEVKDSIDTPAELRSFAASKLPSLGLLIDLKGSSTLGELFFDAQFDEHRDLAKAIPEADALEGSPGFESIIQLRRLCAAGYCRSEKYHDDPAAYPTFLAKRQGFAMVGYSEALSAFVEAADECSGDSCTPRNGLVVLPFATSTTNGDAPFVWVDSLGIKKGACNEQCLDDALAFVQMMNDDAVLIRQLLPSRKAPRYLMPAKQSLNAQLDAEAPYYLQLRPLVANAVAAHGPGLGVALRGIGGRVDEKLSRLP